MLFRFETVWGIHADNPKREDFPPISIMIKDTWKFGKWLLMMKKH